MKLASLYEHSNSIVDFNITESEDKMPQRHRIYAKAGWAFLVFSLLLVFVAANGHALPLKVTDITYSNPAKVTIFEQTAWYYTEYYLETVEYGLLDAFCVDPAGNSEPYDYALTSADLVDPDARALAALYYSGESTWDKEVTQLLVWETQFDDKFDLRSGNFTYHDGAALSDSFILGDVSNPGVPLMLAISPADGGPGPSQDYLVSVPDASLMYLLGPALIGLGILGRRKKA